MIGTGRIAWLARIATCLLAGLATATAQGPLVTNEAELEAAMRTSTLKIDDPVAVFDFVLNSLPDRVKVLPTENYYYFRFAHNGVNYTGNIRLAAISRDQGKVHFAYGEQPSDWRAAPGVNAIVLDAERGVKVERLDGLAYSVSRGGKSVIFALNDLSQVKPPPELLRPDETFIGPIFDESGVRFFLVFNSRLKLFHYLLDETVKVPDAFFAAKVSDRIQIGKRTGFAFYRDDRRKILIGVNERSSRLNTFFDGPFDQLPDNFIEGEALHDAILAVAPDLKGRIDRFGNFADRSERYLIHPYLLYRREADLTVFHRCAGRKSIQPTNRPGCFVIDDAEQMKARPRPLALKRR